jgi:methyl-accepting chemotaxis protein
MTNSFSLFDAVIATLLSVLLGVASFAYVSWSGFGWVSGALIALASLSGLYGVAILQRAEREFDKMSGVLKKLQQGDFEARLMPVTARGRLGELSWSVNDFADRADAFAREASASLEAVAQHHYYRKVIETGMLGAYRHAAQAINAATGDMAHKISGFSAALVQFEQSANQVVGKLRDTSVELTGMAKALNGAASSTNDRTEVAAAATDRASASLQAVAAATEELTASIGEINRQIHRSVEVAHAAVRETESAYGQVDGLVDAASKIGEVVTLIREIAEKTNLLALNATIESARAGEAGKGFAVVASEVKNLANQTARATDDIIEQVNSIQTSVGSVATAIKRARDVINQVDETAAAIAAAMEEQSAATGEIARNVEQASEGSTDVHRSVADVRVVTQETEQAATQLLGSTTDMASQSRHFAEELSGFFGALRKVI